MAPLTPYTAAPVAGNLPSDLVSSVLLSVLSPALSPLLSPSPVSGGGRFRLLQCCDGGAQISGGLVNHSLVGGSRRSLGGLRCLGERSPGINRVIGFLERFGSGDLLVELSQIDLALFNAVNRSIGWIDQTIGVAVVS